jgi:hypothetical protein
MANQKKLFALIAVIDPDKMAAKLATEFPDAHLKVGSSWLLVGESNLTTTEVSHKLHITQRGGYSAR